MKKIKCNFVVVLNSTSVILAVFLLFGIFGCSSENVRPVIFVHGYAGTADQFETQAMRLASNGYPARYISGFEYDTSLLGFRLDPNTFDFADPAAAAEALSVVDSALDAHINSVLLQTGATQVDLLGHSLGTFVSQAYLADPTRAAKVAHYVNIDGKESDAPPGGVPTLALWAELSVPGTSRSIGGATNITLTDMTHVQVVSSVDSFVAIYKLFNNDNAPKTTDIMPQNSNTIELAGRIVTFMTNAVPENLKLDIYEVNKDTGVRIRSTPDYSTSIQADGNFKFTNATAGSNYEFNLSSTVNTTSGHYYYEPFVRSDYLIRLKYIAPAGLSVLMNQSDNHSNLIVIRNKEFLGDNTLYPNEDTLKVNGTELCTGMLPSAGTLGAPIALFIFDNESDGVSDLSGPIAGLSLPFVARVDFFMKAASPPDSTISIVLKGRYSEKTQVVNVPNWQSTTDKITVQMLDY